MDTCANKREQEQIKSLGKILGTYWTRDIVQAMFGPNKNKKQEQRNIDEVMIPLAMWQAPEIGDYLRKLFGAGGSVDKPKWTDEHEEVNLFDADKDTFISFASRFSGLAKTSY